MFNGFPIPLCRLVLIFSTTHVVTDIGASPWLGKHFLRKAALKSLLLAGSAYIIYVTSVTALRTLTKTFYTSLHKMKAIVTSG